MGQFWPADKELLITGLKPPIRVNQSFDLFKINILCSRNRRHCKERCTVFPSLYISCLRVAQKFSIGLEPGEKRGNVICLSSLRSLLASHEVGTSVRGHGSSYLSSNTILDRCDLAPSVVSGGTASWLSQLFEDFSYRQTVKGNRVLI